MKKTLSTKITIGNEQMLKVFLLRPGKGQRYVQSAHLFNTAQFTCAKKQRKKDLNHKDQKKIKLSIFYIQR